MNEITGQEALLVFYAIFWGLIGAQLAKYRLFDTHLLSDKHLMRYAWKRMFVGVTLINLLPILWLLLLLNHVVPNSTSLWAVAAGSVGSFAVFGFHRLVYAFLVAGHNFERYYDKTERERMADALKPHSTDTPARHAFGGVSYLVISIALSFLMGMASSG